MFVQKLPWADSDNGNGNGNSNGNGGKYRLRRLDWYCWDTAKRVTELALVWPQPGKHTLRVTVRWKSTNDCWLAGVRQKPMLLADSDNGNGNGNSDGNGGKYWLRRFDWYCCDTAKRVTELALVWTTSMQAYSEGLSEATWCWQTEAQGAERWQEQVKKS